MSGRLSFDEAPTLVVRSVRVSPTRHRRHTVVRVIGEEVSASGRRTGVIHVIGDFDDGPTAA